MSKKVEILDEPLLEKELILTKRDQDTPSTSFLILKGSFYITLCSCSILLGSGFFVIIPIGCYIFLLFKHQEILDIITDGVV